MKLNTAALLALICLSAPAAGAATHNPTVQRIGAQWRFIWENVDASCDIAAFSAQTGVWIFTLNGAPVNATLSGGSVFGGSRTYWFAAPDGVLTEATRNGDHVFTCGTDALALPGFAAPPVTVTPAAVPNAQVGVPFSQALTVGGGYGAPYTFTLLSGTLPAGLSFDTSSGVISGTPTTIGSSSFTVRAFDNSQFFVDQAYTITTAAVVVAPTQPASIPTLSEWGLILTSAMLGLFGFASMRRRP